MVHVVHEVLWGIYVLNLPLIPHFPSAIISRTLSLTFLILSSY